MSCYDVLKNYPSQLPRYTSYPTAPHFYALEQDNHGRWLSQLDGSPVSLYLHIPYCKQLCWFCGCNTRITEKYDPVVAYLDVLMCEAKLVSQLLGRRQAVAHVHFGGGSPTLLACEDFGRLMETVRSCFDVIKDADISIEVDPRGITEAKIARYANTGVNRISIGVQDFDADVQKAINRVQPFSMVYDTVTLCREYGISDISMDLLYGLPRQSLASLCATIDKALLFTPNRISLFGYAHVPWKKKNMRLIDEHLLPDGALRHAMFESACSQLQKTGYQMIGLDHFALPGDSMAVALKNRTLRRNFQGYTTDRAETLIGLGASAISALPQGYVQNHSTVEAYAGPVKADKLATSRGFALTPEVFLRRSIIERVMCYYEADIGELCENAGFPADHCDAVLEGFGQMVADGIVTVDFRTLRVHPDCPQGLRIVSSAFDTYITSGPGKHSQVA